MRHFIEHVLVCEGGPDWSIADYGNGYVSRLQFHAASWAAAARRTGFWDGTDPYAVGRNAAWWINNIKDPGGTEGWPTCWHVVN